VLEASIEEAAMTQRRQTAQSPEAGKVLAPIRVTLTALPRPGAPDTAMAAEPPAIDLYESDAEFVVHAELPGVPRDQIELDLTGTVLTIGGQNDGEADASDEDDHCQRRFGAFASTISLPAEVNVERARAVLKDGVLEVHLPKIDAAQWNPVKVRVD
jgi:HSP20 family protein